MSKSPPKPISFIEVVIALILTQMFTFGSGCAFASHDYDGATFLGIVAFISGITTIIMAYLYAKH
jgi:hypothetical protein